MSSDEVLKDLKSLNDGITEKEAKTRLSKYGYNKLKETKKKSFLSRFIDQFKNVMLIILIIAAILSAVVSSKTGEPFTDTIIILFVVFLNALLGVIQESKAEKAIEALKNMSLPYIKVKRDGKVLSVKTEELVIGDVVLIEAGDYVPADMRIIVNHSLRVEESALTGESVAVDKKEEKITSNSKVALADRTNMLYSGSSVVYGRGEAVVVATGMNTELGKIAQAISSQKAEITPLQKKMNELSKILSILVVVIAVIMFVVGYLEGNPILDVFMLAISLAVAAIPEGLSAVITITLAIGVQKMAKEKAIIRKLSSVEALGSTEVICSDKTGTLTQNKMTLRKIYIDNNLIDVTDIKSNKELKKRGTFNESDLNTLVNISMLCNDIKFGEDSGKKVLLGDPTEAALIEFGHNIGYNKEEMDTKYKRVDELPFDSTRKMMTTVNEFENEYMVCTKGAIESILNNCNRILINGKIEKLDLSTKNKIMQNNLEMAKCALRVLACAYKMERKEQTIDKSEKNLVFAGLVGMIDPPRKEAKRAVERCFNAGMVPVMITGDNKDTAMAIAKELGILKDGYEAVTGTELDAMSDKELYKRVDKIRVYARVSPENKIRIVKAWKKRGKTVAMTGDGVNDVLALKEADCSIAMINGSDAARNVSQIVLMDSNFDSMPKVVLEGRRTINNIQRSASLFLTKTIYTSLMVIFLLFFHFMYPFRPIELTLMNFVTIGAPALVLALEPNSDRVKGGFLVNVVANALPTALAVFISLVAIIIVGNTYHFTPDEMSTMAVLVTTIIMLIYQAKLCIPFNAIRTAMYTVMCLMFSLAIVFFRGFFMMTLLSVKALIAFIIILTVGILLWFFFNKILNKNKEKLEKFL